MRYKVWRMGKAYLLVADDVYIRCTKRSGAFQYCICRQCIYLLQKFHTIPKYILYHRLGHLHKLSEIPQCLTHNSTFIINPTDKAEAFNNFFISTFTLIDFKLPPLDQMPTPRNQLSLITTDECDVFRDYPISVLPRRKAATTLVHLY